METKMENLSKTQEEHLPAIMWLISPSNDLRCTGRTRTLAYAFLKTAVLNPGRDIPIFDHLTHPTSYMQVMREIRLMMASDEFKKCKIEFNIAAKTVCCKE